MIDAVKRASARRITAVIPYFGYARQDRKDQPRVPISAKLVANLLESAGADRILTMDLHASQIQGFFDIPMDHLFAVNTVVDYFTKKKIKNLLIASPDVGGIKMARAYAKRMNAHLAIVDKFWHQHILDTRKYAEDCERIFGFFFHHFPYFGMRGAEDKANLDSCFTETNELFVQEFGAAMPIEMDGSGSCDSCGKDSCSHSGWCSKCDGRKEDIINNKVRPTLATIGA